MLEALPQGSRSKSRYELLLDLASGGMATVFLGRQTGDGGFERVVAIKRLHAHLASDPSVVATLLNEARLASLIQHPNVVSVLDVYQAEGQHLLVMDYIDGATLATFFAGLRQRQVPLPIPIALRIVCDTLSGLHAAHRQTGRDGQALGIVHRDATPHNILISSEGVSKIADFGIARATEVSSHTATGQTKGKVRYMSPEQLAGRSIDCRTDIFAMGVVLWELCAGRRMFPGLVDAAVMLRIAEASLPSLSSVQPGIHPELEYLIERALAPDPALRYASAEEFSEALESWVEKYDRPASTRHVAQLLQRVLGEELQSQRSTLEQVLQATSPGLSGQLGPLTQTPHTDTFAALPLNAERVVAPRPKRFFWLAAALSAFVLVGSLGFWAVNSMGSSTPDLVAVELIGETRLVEIRGDGVGEVQLDPDRVRFKMPRGFAPVELTLIYEDGATASRWVMPDRDVALAKPSVETLAVDALPVLPPAQPEPEPALAASTEISPGVEPPADLASGKTAVPLKDGQASKRQQTGAQAAPRATGGAQQRSPSKTKAAPGLAANPYE